MRHVGSNGCQALVSACAPAPSPYAASLEPESVQSPMTLTCYSKRVGLYRGSFFPIEKHTVKLEKNHSKAEISASGRRNIFVDLFLFLP